MLLTNDEDNRTKAKAEGLQSFTSIITVKVERTHFYGIVCQVLSFFGDKGIKVYPRPYIHQFCQRSLGLHMFDSFNIWFQALSFGKLYFVSPFLVCHLSISCLPGQSICVPWTNILYV